MNISSNLGGPKRTSAPRLPVAARVAAGLGAMALAAVCLGSQLALVAVYSGEAGVALAQLRPARAASQTASQTATHASPMSDDVSPQRFAQAPRKDLQ